MFTGIIEDIGVVKNLESHLGNLDITIESQLAPELKIDQSIAHNGVCLTVVSVDDNSYKVTAIHETLKKTNLNQLKINGFINLERAMKLGDRLDGHLVQGHVDQTAICTSINHQNGSWIFNFEYDPSLNNTTIEKGSITINGTSLTVIDSKTNGFSVAIIPYTFQHTTFKYLNVGDAVNLEFDMIGKYVSKLLANKKD